MVHYAEINPTTNEVLRVIVCDSKEWCEQNLGGTWVRTYYSTPGKNYAGTGYTYHPDKENFASPQPFPSWTLDDQCIWQPPTPYPGIQYDDNGNRIVYNWDEATLSWQQVSSPTYTIEG